MEGMLQTTLAVLAGVCLYAAVHHLWIGLQQPRQALHLLFALMCLLVGGYALNQIDLYHADSPETLVQFRRIQQTLAALILGMLPWFVALYTGMRTGLPCRLLSLALAGLILASWILPYGLYYAELPTLQQRMLPWGETIADLRIGGKGLRFLAVWAAFTLVLAHAVYSCAHQFRHGVRRRAVMLALALGLFFISVLINFLVNADLLNFMHTAEFGFIALVLLMSVTLSGELHSSRGALVASEARFRILAEQAADAIYLHDTQGQIVDVNQQACRGLGYARDELLRMRVADIEVEISPAHIAAICEDMQLDTPVTLEGRHRRKDGTTFPVEVRIGCFTPTAAISRWQSRVTSARADRPKRRCGPARSACAQRSTTRPGWPFNGMTAMATCCTGTRRPNSCTGSRPRRQWARPCAIFCIHLSSSRVFSTPSRESKNRACPTGPRKSRCKTGRGQK